LINELKELLGKRWKEYSLQQTWSYYPYYPITYTDNQQDEIIVTTCSTNKWVHLTEN